MKNLLTFYCLIISFCAFAQAPQGFTYQAVATNNNGFELVEQNISVRVSILSESSTGVEQWIETHSTTTDGFGLFTITIGQGTSTGSGVQSSFSEIDWGASEHHLKIEMDVDGGSDYQLLGISQLMSVPYALYAESSGTPGPEGPEGPPGEPAPPVDYDSLATILASDSTFINYFGNNGSLSFGERIPLDITFSIVDWNQNETIEYQATDDGFLCGIVRLYANDSAVNLFIGGSLRAKFSTGDQVNGAFYQSFNVPIKQGEFYKFTSTSATSVNVPYLMKLENGGESSTISSNSVGDFSYPDGKEDITPVIHDFGNGDYSVPSGENLYITSYWGINSTDELQISSNTIFKGRGQYSNGQNTPIGHFELPIIASSSEIVSAPGLMNGFLVDASITPITFSLSGNYVNDITYTVPPGKILVVLNFYSAMNGSYGCLQADGMMQLYGIFNYFDNISGCSPACESTNIKNPLIFDENTIISSQGWSDFQVINGYLMDK